MISEGIPIQSGEGIRDDDIQFEDNHILVVNKHAGWLSQPDYSDRPNLKVLAEDYLIKRYNKSGRAFVGIVHRLDREVSGLIVLAKTSKALSRLNQSLREGKWEKFYIAAVEGILPKNGEWHDKIEKTEGKGSVGSGKDSSLSFETLNQGHGVSLAKILLGTGRYHQIRAQFSSRKFPILGDKAYGAKPWPHANCIALHCQTLTFPHPIGGEPHHESAPVPDYFPKF